MHQLPEPEGVEEAAGVGGSGGVGSVGGSEETSLDGGADGSESRSSSTGKTTTGGLRNHSISMRAGNKRWLPLLSDNAVAPEEGSERPELALSLTSLSQPSIRPGWQQSRSFRQARRASSARIIVANAAATAAVHEGLMIGSPATGAATPRDRVPPIRPSQERRRSSQEHLRDGGEGTDRNGPDGRAFHGGGAVLRRVVRRLTSPLRILKFDDEALEVSIAPDMSTSQPALSFMLMPGVCLYCSWAVDLSRFFFIWAASG